MASLRVLAFDHEGKPVAFETWHNDLQLYLLSDIKDSVSLFDHVSGVAPAPPATADGVTRSQWLSRDATARLAICNHLPVAECTHFGQHRTAHALYDAVVARYSSPATAALGRLLLPYLFPELSAFATVADLVTHLRTSDARYRATVPADVSLFDHVSGVAPAPPATADGVTRSQWLSRDATARLAICNHLPVAECTHFGQHRTAHALYDAVVARYSSPATAALGRLLLPYLFPELSAFATVADLVTHLRTSDARYRATVPAEDHFLSLEPTSLTVDLLEQHLLAAETSAVVVGVARCTPRPPFFEGCSPSPLSPSFASAAAADVSVTEDVGAASTSVKRRSSKGKGGRGSGGGSGGGGGGSGSGGGGSGGGRGGSGGGGGGGTGGGSGGSGGGGGGSGGSGGSGGGGTRGGKCGPWRGGPGGGIAAASPRASASGTPPGTAPAEALHTFTLDFGASRCFFRDSTTLTPLPAPVPVRLADPSGDPIVARSSTVLPCPAVPSGSLSGLHLLSFSTNLVSTAALQDAMVTTTTPGGQRVSICTCTRTRRPLATSGSRLLLVSPLVAPDSSVAPPPGSPLPATPSWHALPVSRLWSTQGRERYFLLVVDNYTRYTTVFPLRSKGEVLDVLILWIRTVCLHLRERFCMYLLVQCLHSNKGGEFSSDLLRDFCRGEGILQSFKLPESPQQNGIAERRIGLVMEVARTSMIHAAAPHFLWPFAVRYTAHQLNLWPRVSLPETSPTLRWTGKVGDASVFRFYHPTSRRVLPSQDVTFDESVPFYRLFLYRSAPPPPLLLAPGPPPVDTLPPQGPAPSGVSQVDPLPGTAPVQVAVGSGAAPGAASRGAASGGPEPGGAGSEGVGSGGAEPGSVEPEGVEPGGAESEGAESVGAAPRGAASSGGPIGALPRLSLQQLREWLVRRAHRRSGAPGAGGAGDTGAGGAAVTTGAGGTGGTAATEPGGARTCGAGAAGTGSVGCAGAGDPTEPGAAGAGGAGAGGAGVGAGAAPGV
ncbi:unnamed protein product, partial [Closterium sp. NIES-53]